MPELHIGQTDAGEPVSLPLDAVTRRLAIVAMSGAGKSNAAVVLAEGMYQAGIPWLAVDPKGDWWGIRSAADGKSPGLPIPIFGGRHGDLPLEPGAGKVIGDLVIETRLTCVLDVSLFSNQERWGFLHDLGETLLRQPPQVRHLFLEEAADYIPQITREGGNQPKCLGTWQRVVRIGRTIGLGSSQITQRTAALSNDTLYMAEALIALRTVGPGDLKAIRGWVEHSGASKEILRSLPSLEDGEAWLSSPAWLKRTDRLRFNRRQTFDSGATPVLLDGTRPPATLADVDLEDLRSRMAETVERVEADDPEKLRARISELEREVSASSKTAPVQENIRVEPCDHEPIIEELRGRANRLYRDLQEAKGLAERIAGELGRERTAIDKIIDALSGQQAGRLTIEDIAFRLQSAPEKVTKPEENDDKPDSESLRSDNGSKASGLSPGRSGQSSGRPRGSRSGNASSGQRDDEIHRRPEQTLGGVPPVARPGGMGAGQGRARATGRNIEDMTEDEAREFIRQEVARQMKDSGRTLIVPPAEVIRKDYLTKAIERLMGDLKELSPEALEAYRLLLSRNVFMTVGEISTVISGYQGGAAQVKWGTATKALLDAGLVAKGGSGGSGYKASDEEARERVRKALAPHLATDKEIEDVFQAVLGRIAGEVLV